MKCPICGKESPTSSIVCPRCSLTNITPKPDVLAAIEYMEQAAEQRGIAKGKAEERVKFAEVVTAAAKVIDLIECTACGDFINPGCNAKNKHRPCPKNTLKSELAKIEEGRNANT